MRTKLVAAAAIALGASAVIPSPARAATTDECQGLLAVLLSDTAEASSLSARTKEGLVAKAEAAAKADRDRLITELKGEFGRLVAATTAQAPQQVGILGLAGCNKSSIG